MKHIILMILIALSSVAFGYEQGDILFQESKSSQAPYIKKATGSRYTHCGIIYIKDGKEYVLEYLKKRAISLDTKVVAPSDLL